MSTLAVVGAGPGLGEAVARRFAREGFAIALLARDATRVAELAASVRDSGATAEGFAADVRHPDQLTAALEQAASRLGPIEVLQYSPKPAREFMKPVLETTAADLVGPVEFSIYGSVSAVHAVLPGMRERGRGTILYVNGASAVRPAPTVTGTSVAFAAESAYAQLLHDALKPEGVHVAQLIIPRGIGGGEPSHEPDVLADRLWSLHAEPGAFRTYAAEL